MSIIKGKVKKTNIISLIKRHIIVFLLNQLSKLKFILINKFSGIDMGGTTPPRHKNDPSSNYCPYQPSDTWYLKKIMEVFLIKQSDKLLDYGSGKGAAMIFFSRYPFCEIGGIEYDENLHETAKNNFKLKELNYLTSYYGDATQFTNIDHYTYFFLFNPFLGKVLELTIEQIKQSFTRSPRKITVIYQNPRENVLFVNSGLFPYIRHCFVPSILNFNKDNKGYGRQFIDIYCTEQLNIDYAKSGIKLIENCNDK